MTDEQRAQLSRDLAGRTIESFTWVTDGGYWVLTLQDGSEMLVRLMVEEPPEWLATDDGYLLCPTCKGAGGNNATMTLCRTCKGVPRKKIA